MVQFIKKLRFAFIYIEAIQMPYANTFDFLVSTIHTTQFHNRYVKMYFGVLH